MQKEKQKQVTKQDVEALIDNELDSIEANRILSAMAKNPDLKKHYLDIRHQQKVLKEWWACHADLDL